MFTIGMQRAIEEDDIFAVTNSMRSDHNTGKLAELWNLELKKKRPSMLRVMLKANGYKVHIMGVLFSLTETIARWEFSFDSQIRFSSVKPRVSEYRH